MTPNTVQELVTIWKDEKDWETDKLTSFQSMEIVVKDYLPMLDDECSNIVLSTLLVNIIGNYRNSEDNSVKEDLYKFIQIMELLMSTSRHKDHRDDMREFYL